MTPLNASVEKTNALRLNWCATTEHLIDAVGDLLGLSPSYVRVIQDISFQPRHWIFFLEFRHKVSLFLRVNHGVRFNTYCFAGVKKGLSIFACEFVHYMTIHCQSPHFRIAS